MKANLTYTNFDRIIGYYKEVISFVHIVRVKLIDQETPVIAEVFNYDKDGITFSFIGNYTLGSKEFKHQLITKKYLNKEFEIIYDNLVS